MQLKWNHVKPYNMECGIIFREIRASCFWERHVSRNVKRGVNVCPG